MKQLDRNGIGKEILTAVSDLCMLQHENLVNLIGYCTDGDQRLLVYELFSGRTLESRLFGKLPFSCFTRYLFIRFFMHVLCWFSELEASI